MPFISTWIPAPSDESIPVVQGDEKTPPGGFCSDDIHVGGVPEVVSHGPFLRMYHCRFCEGWIDGEPTEFRINTLGVLSGRRGSEFYCRRCGQELAFFGMMS